MIALAILYLCAVGALIALMLTAEEGWEDAAGFHRGREPLDDLGRRLSDRDGFVAPFDPFHSPAPSPEAQHDHG